MQTTAQEEDVWKLYALVLRREPENRKVLNSRVGRDVTGIFREMLNSDEFCNSVLPAMVSGSAGRANYIGSHDFEDLRDWAVTALSLHGELAARLASTPDWAAFDSILIADSEVLAWAPAVRKAGVRVAV